MDRATLSSEIAKNPQRRTLVIGWFSFEMMGATAGDLIAKDVACNWLGELGIRPTVAVFEPHGQEEIATTAVKPTDYDDVVFVCGPIGDGPPLNTFLDGFPHARKFALNVTLLQTRAEWNPFAAIIERDSAERSNPDITFAADDLEGPCRWPDLRRTATRVQDTATRRGRARCRRSSRLSKRCGCSYRYSPRRQQIRPLVTRADRVCNGEDGRGGYHPLARRSQGSAPSSATRGHRLDSGWVEAAHANETHRMAALLSRRRPRRGEAGTSARLCPDFRGANRGGEMRRLGTALS